MANVKLYRAFYIGDSIYSAPDQEYFDSIEKSSSKQDKLANSRITSLMFSIIINGNDGEVVSASGDAASENFADYLNRKDSVKSSIIGSENGVTKYFVGAFPFTFIVKEIPVPEDYTYEKCKIDERLLLGLCFNDRKKSKKALDKLDKNYSIIAAKWNAKNNNKKDAGE